MMAKTVVQPTEKEPSGSAIDKSVAGSNQSIRQAMSPVETWIYGADAIEET